MPPLRILILENVAAQAAAVRDALIRAGHKVVISRFSSESLARLGEWKADLVIISSGYAEGKLSLFCRELRRKGGASLRIVVASPLSAEGLFEDSPELRNLVHGFVPRPYDPPGLVSYVERIMSEPAGSRGPQPGEGLERTGRDEVLFIGRDPGIGKALREHLRPEGVDVATAEWEEAVTSGLSRRPEALVMEWPVPESFSISALREIQEAADGTRFPLILLSAAGREVVKVKTPALLNRADMLFTKPVPWDHLVRFLLRALGRAPAARGERRAAADRPAGASPPAGEKELREAFQRQLEEKFLEAAELRRRISQIEEEGSQGGAGELENLLGENRRLLTALEKAKKETELELAKQKFREAELDTRLTRLLRQQTESEQRAQDLLDGAREMEEELRRSLAEAHGELQMREEQHVSLKRDLEAARIEVERIRESAKRTEVELAKQRFREADLEMQMRNLLRRKSEAERKTQDLLDGAKEREEVMQRSLADAHGELHARTREMNSLRQDLQEALLARQRAEEEARSTRLSMEKARGEARELGERLRAEGDGMRSEADALRRRVEEAEGREKDAARRLSLLEGEVAGLRDRAAQAESRAAALGEEAAGLREEGREWEEMAAALEAKAAELQAALREKEELESRLEAAVGEKDRDLEDVKEKLHSSELAVAGLDEELSGWRERLSEAEAALAEREGAEEEREVLAARVRELEERSGERSAAVERLERELEQKDAELNRQGVLLVEASEKIRRLESQRVSPGRVEELEGVVAAGERSLAELGARLEEAHEEAGRLRTLLDERERAGAPPREQPEEMERLSRELEESRRERDELEGTLRPLQEEVKTLKADLERTAGERRLEETAAAELRHRLERAEGELEERRKLQEALEKGIDGAVEERRLEEATAAELRRRLERAERDLETQRATRETLEERLGEAAAWQRRAESDSAGLRQSLERAGKDLEKQREIRETLEGRIDGAVEDRRQARAEAADLRERVERLQMQLDAEKSARAELVRSRDLELRREREQREALEARQEEMSRKVLDAEAGAREEGHVRQLLEEVMSRAQAEVIDRTRREVELEERLKTSLEEKKFLLSRLERELSEAAGRERRLSELLEKSLQGSAELAASFAEGGRASARDNLPVALPEKERKAPARVFPSAAAALVLLALGAVAWFAAGGDALFRQEEAVDGTGAGGGDGGRGADALSTERVAWEDWTRSDVSGGVLLQATFRTREELAVEVQAERKSRGLSEREAEQELRRLLEPYRFDENFYFYLYLKNLHPGYPAYADDIHSRLVLRDDEGNETPAFIPADLEEHRRLYSFASGDLAQSRQELRYEVSVPVAFSRSALSPSPAYLELLAFNIGSSSRRVLTWELQ